MTTILNRSVLKLKRRSLRRNVTKAEILVWSKLRARQILNCKFQRQYSIGSYILDFYCQEKKIAIEIDGDTYAGNKADIHDSKRTSYLNSFGIQALRFTNFEVFENLNGVLEKITEHFSLNQKIQTIPPPFKGGVRGGQKEK
jgi:very-short-patch-repair endonuclease